MEFRLKLWHTKFCISSAFKFTRRFSISFASMFSSGLITNLGNHVPFRGDFNPLNKLYDVGKSLELDIRHRGIVSLGFVE